MSKNNPVDKKLAKLPVHYNPLLAVTICEYIASGMTVTEVVEQPDMPSKNTLYSWLTLYPEFQKAYERARTISAQSFEDEALDLARILKEPNAFTGVKVRAYEVAMGQLRWSAARRDPDRYGQKNNSANTVLPIQINTTLNLGQEGPAKTVTENIYTVKATVTVPEPGDEDKFEEDILDLTAEPDPEPESLPFDVPETEAQRLHRPARKKPKPKAPPGKREAAALRFARAEKRQAAYQKAKAKATAEEETDGD